MVRMCWRSYSSRVTSKQYESTCRSWWLRRMRLRSEEMRLRSEQSCWKSKEWSCWYSWLGTKMSTQCGLFWSTAYVNISGRTLSWLEHQWHTSVMNWWNRQFFASVQMICKSGFLKSLPAWNHFAEDGKLALESGLAITCGRLIAHCLACTMNCQMMAALALSSPMQTRTRQLRLSFWFAPYNMRDVCRCLGWNGRKLTFVIVSIMMHFVEFAAKHHLTAVKYGYIVGERFATSFLGLGLVDCVRPD